MKWRLLETESTIFAALRLLLLWKFFLKREDYSQSKAGKNFHDYRGAQTLCDSRTPGAPQFSVSMNCQVAHLRPSRGLALVSG